MLTFVKLGGSLITNKETAETARLDVIQRLSNEIAEGIRISGAKVVVGHGSGSFGHIIGKKYGTRAGVSTPEQWAGFSEVGLVASRLTNIVIEALAAAGAKPMRFQPSASVIAKDGVITRMETATMQLALSHGLTPLVHGDVALDHVKGGTIVSTEEIFLFLVGKLHPERILLVGDYDGVLNRSGQIIETITDENYGTFESALGSSGSTDVTGGMLSKVQTMLALSHENPGLQTHIFSGREHGLLTRMLADPKTKAGTVIKA